jgi:hypothetical protein
MNLKDITKVIGMASSGEMQNFIAAFQAELEAIKHDRLGLKQAFPVAYNHFDQRMTRLESKVDTILTLLSARGDQGAVVTAEHSNVGSERTDHAAGQQPVNGTIAEAS